MTFRYRIEAAHSSELENLWAWSQQFQGEPGRLRLPQVDIDLQSQRRQLAIKKEIESMGGKWTRQDFFAFPSRAQLMFFRMKWG